MNLKVGWYCIISRQMANLIPGQVFSKLAEPNIIQKLFVINLSYSILYSIKNISYLICTKISNLSQFFREINAFCVKLQIILRETNAYSTLSSI